MGAWPLDPRGPVAAQIAFVYWILFACAVVVLAIVTAVVTSQAGANGTPSQVLDAFRPGLAVATGVAALGLAVALSGVLLRERHAQPATAAEG